MDSVSGLGSGCGEVRVNKGFECVDITLGFFSRFFLTTTCLVRNAFLELSVRCELCSYFVCGGIVWALSSSFVPANFGHSHGFVY